MLAAENSIYEDVADAVYKAMLDGNVREACRRYEEQKATEARIIRERDEALQGIEEREIVIQEKEMVIHDARARIAELEKALAEAKKNE